MSETKYESKVYSTKNSAHTVYTVLSNLENLNRVKDLIPKDPTCYFFQNVVY